MGRQSQGKAGVRAAVDPAADLASGAHDETEEKGLAAAEDEASRTWLGEVGEGAEARPGAWIGGAQTGVPTVWRQALISTRSNRPAWR